MLDWNMTKPGLEQNSGTGSGSKYSREKKATAAAIVPPRGQSGNLKTVGFKLGHSGMQ